MLYCILLWCSSVALYDYDTYNVGYCVDDVVLDGLCLSHDAINGTQTRTGAAQTLASVQRTPTSWREATTGTRPAASIRRTNDEAVDAEKGQENEETS